MANARWLGAEGGVEDVDNDDDGGENSERATGECPLHDERARERLEEWVQRRTAPHPPLFQIGEGLRQTRFQSFPSPQFFPAIFSLSDAAFGNHPPAVAPVWHTLHIAAQQVGTLTGTAFCNMSQSTVASPADKKHCKQLGPCPPGQFRSYHFPAPGYLSSSCRPLVPPTAGHDMAHSPPRPRPASECI
ncbi:hypothetical protein SCHPADRAFT_934636 [Schizopora paradoxa]|uniref:Uncharacterized protein n=1 Tax=Schizopora paradoxa TaxID=27342 RepID=A0A0H2SE75_9AGAM|nr:hypothetical protein SCHPADRAFT_934636 [Schizopora paradoxa]